MNLDDIQAAVDEGEACLRAALLAGRVIGPDGRTRHAEDSEHCWCAPRCVFTDPATGAQVWVHNEPEDAN